MVCLIVFFIFVDRLRIESYFSETKIDEGQLYHCDAHVYFILTFFFSCLRILGILGTLYVITKLWILVQNLNPQNARNIRIYNVFVKVTLKDIF